MGLSLETGAYCPLRGALAMMRGKGCGATLPSMGEYGKEVWCAQAVVGCTNRRWFMFWMHEDGLAVMVPVVDWQGPQWFCLM